MQCAGESAASEEFTRLGLFLENVSKCAGDVLEDLAVLLSRQARRDADVGDEELVVLATYRKSPELRAAREERLHLQIELRLDFHGSTVFPARCASGPAPRARTA